MKFFVIAFAILIGVNASASGECEAQDGKEAHESFCSGHDKAACRVHSTVCSWKDQREIIVKVEKSESQKSCTSKAGKEAHESFCSAHNKFICSSHAALCEWK